MIKKEIKERRSRIRQKTLFAAAPAIKKMKKKNVRKDELIKRFFNENEKLTGRNK